MPKPDTRMDDKRRAVAKKALEERGRRSAERLSDDPEEANVQAEQYFQDLPRQRYSGPDGRPLDSPTPLHRGQVVGGPEASGWTGRFSTAQASDPKGGQTVEEAAAGHKEVHDEAEGRFWDLVGRSNEEIDRVHQNERPGGGWGRTPYTFDLDNVYEFLDPKYQKMMDSIEATRPEMERTEAAREEFEEEFPPEDKEEK